MINRIFSLNIGFLLLFFFASAAYAEIDVNKSFTPAVVTATETTTVTVTLLNSALITADNVSFTDVLPADVFIASTPNASTTCGAGVVAHSNNATGGQVSLAGGVIPAGDGTNPGTCEVTIDVYPASKGTFINTIGVGDVTAINGGVSVSNTQSTDATLVALLSDLTGSISYSISGSYGYVQGGETIRTTIQLNNPNNVPLTGVAFSNLLNTYANIVKAVDGTATTTCTGGSVTITDVGISSTVELDDGKISANGSCEVSFDIIPSRDPKATYYYTNRYQTLPVNAVTTTQGATNATLIRARVYAATGVRIYKYFDSSTDKEINLLNGNTSQLRILYRNYNTTAVSNFNFTDVMPTSGATGVMSIDSIDSNTCGGSTASSTATSLNITNGTLPAATLNAAGIQNGICEIRATVSVNGVGTYQNTIPEGDLAGFNYTATYATLTAVADALKITKAFNSSYFYQGDTRNLIYTFQNNTDSVTGVDITDLNFDDDFETPTEFRVATPSSVTTTCQNATVNAVANSQLVSISNLTIPKGASCTVTVPVEAASNAYPLGWVYDNVPVGDIEYLINGAGATQTYALALQSRANLRAGMRIYKTFTPTVVGPLGVTRLRVELRHTSYDQFAVDQVAFTDVLPTGHEVASPANVVNECGGTVTATPGSNTISLTGGLLTSGATTRICYVYVNVKVPALSGGLSTQTATNTIPGVPHGVTPLNYTGQKVGALAGQGLMENYYNASANITRTATSVVVNKEFLPVSINGGGISRVRVTISNTDSAAIDLTQVGLTDDFSGTDLRLFTNISPTFTDTSGNSTGLCRGGEFTGIPGAKSITLSNAIVDKNATCRFEFNVTASVGGNHINTIEIGDVSTLEGVSNSLAAAATLTVGRQVNVGKGFSPTTIAADETSVLTLEFFNTNETIVEQGASPVALIDVMPAGLSVDNIIANTCAGGTVTIGSSGGNDTVQLSGGTFPAASTCKVTATVSGTPGTYVNRIAIGDLKTASGAYNPDPAEATLVIVDKPTIVKAFSPTQIAANGTSTVTLRLYNPNSAVALTGASLVDNLTNMVIATPPNVSGTCADRAFTATPGSNQFVLSNATIPAGSNCTVSFTVTSSVTGSHPNQTSGLSTNQTSTPSTPSNEVSLAVVAPLTMTKVFNLDAISTNQTSKLTFTLTNPNSTAIAIGSTGFTDTFPTTPGNMVIASPANITTTCGSQVRNLDNSGNAVSGDVGVIVKYGSVPANDSCIVSMDIAVDAVGNYANTTSTLTTVGGTTAAASDTLTVTAPVTDYSDAPPSYGEAIHNVTTGIQLGATITNETSSVTDADNASDDGVSTLSTLFDQDRTYSVNVITTNQTSNPARLIAWIDFDGNGSFDSDEAAMRTVASGTVGGSVTLKWSNIPLDIQPGNTYARLRFTTESINNREPNGLKSDGEVEDHPITIVSSGKSISGRVFIDANSDTVVNSGETGIGSSIVVLHNTVLGTCRSIKTNGGGYYSFTGVTDGDYEIYQAHGEITPIPKNCGTSFAKNPVGYQSTTADILFANMADSNITGQHFGEVAGANNVVSGNTGRGIAFEPDHQGEVLPGNVIFYTHTLTSEADGSVKFTTIGSGNATAGWAHTLYWDRDCNGTLNGIEGDAVINGINLGIAKGGRLCIIDKIYAPANVAAQDHYDVTTTATFTYPAASSLSPIVLNVTDTTTSAGQSESATQAPTVIGESRLELRKTVENIIQLTGETETLNEAAPGDILKYRIYYRNTGTGSITELKVDDKVPAYTEIVVGSVRCDNTPAGMNCNPIINLDQLKWVFTGQPLVGGANGHVSYEVEVDN